MIDGLPPLIEDERPPALRDVIGALMTSASRSDFAVQHVRLAAVDFSATELARVRCRLLLGRFDADQLADLGADRSQERIGVLAEFLDSGRLEIRTGGLLRWYPDFSVHRNGNGVQAGIALLGTHQLGGIPGSAMPRLTAVLTGAAVGRLSRHFQRLWRAGHDVREVIRAELGARGA
ncbi:MAG TPA: hypothetical protein VK939_11955 [Longimicrobiales bacterium]|nr:hypothetical protein [Longimicrobiales bacterium]